jgi:hypothetical protein
MNHRKVQFVIEGLVRHARSEILREFSPDSCIVSTAVAIDVLAMFGFLAQPLPVQIALFNEPYAKRILAGQSPLEKDLVRWGQEDGSYSVGLGYGHGDPTPGKWAGHLVALVENQYLVDLSIDQASRTRHKMNFQPFAMEIDDKDVFWFWLNNCLARLTRMDNRGYVTAPDWQDGIRRQRIIKCVYAKILEEVENGSF